VNLGLPLNASDLARHLREYDIKSHTLKSFEKKGYHRAHFEDAWRRYAPPLLPENAVTVVTSVTNGGEVTAVTPVTPLQGNRGSKPDNLDIPDSLRCSP
jgi:uncharacterized protein DUF3631